MLVHPHASGDDLIAQTPYFDFFRVTSSMALGEVMSLRFEVYCIERQFLPAEDYPDGRETDAFNDCSIHFLARHRSTGIPAGTARLILPSPRAFPLLSRCSFDDAYQAIVNDHARLRKFAEVSRVAVSKRYRQRAGDTMFGGPPRGAADAAATGMSPVVGDFPLTAGPEIVAGLYKCLYQEWIQRELTDLLAAMERGLALLLRRMSIRFEPIGPETDYYGPVRPYLLNRQRLEQELLQQRPEVLRYWLRGLPESLWPLSPSRLEAQVAARTTAAAGRTGVVVSSPLSQQTGDQGTGGQGSGRP